MAARQDQTLQIALIIFVGLTVILFGTLIYVNRLKADYRQQAETLTQEKSDEAGKARNLQNENESYRKMMGHEAFDSFDEVQKQFTTDMEQYGSTFAEEDREYREIVSQLHSENRRSAEQESQAKEREKQLKERLLAVEKEKDAQIRKFQETVKQVEADAASQRNKFVQDREAINSTMRELEATVERQRADFEEKLAKLRSENSTLETDLASTTRSRQKLLDDRKQESPSFETSDGTVTWVNQANRTVWINLGEADSLRRQVTFSVYEQSAADAGKAEKKASIEVTRLLGDHMAEARINDDNARNPILPGDNIYSQVWQRGKKIHFALTGVLDIDGDGDSDLQQVKDLINLNGGVVDASVDAEGNIDGTMSVETRYLVSGPSSAAASKSALREKWEEMKEEAQTKGVEIITLDELLSRMGYKPLDNTIGLGSGSSGKSGPRKFRPRSPYATFGG